MSRVHTNLPMLASEAHSNLIYVRAYSMHLLRGLTTVHVQQSSSDCSTDQFENDSPELLREEELRLQYDADWPLWRIAVLRLVAMRQAAAKLHENVIRASRSRTSSQIESSDTTVLSESEHNVASPASTMSWYAWWRYSYWLGGKSSWWSGSNGGNGGSIPSFTTVATPAQMSSDVTTSLESVPTVKDAILELLDELAMASERFDTDRSEPGPTTPTTVASFQLVCHVEGCSIRLTDVTPPFPILSDGFVKAFHRTLSGPFHPSACDPNSPSASLFWLVYEVAPVGVDFEYSLEIKTDPLHVVYQLDLLQCVLNFFRTVASAASPNLETSARHQYQVIKERTQANIRAMFDDTTISLQTSTIEPNEAPTVDSAVSPCPSPLVSTGQSNSQSPRSQSVTNRPRPRRWRINLDIAAPRLLLPANPECPNLTDTSNLVGLLCDFGHLRVTNWPPPPVKPSIEMMHTSESTFSGDEMELFLTPCGTPEAHSEDEECVDRNDDSNKTQLESLKISKSQNLYESFVIQLEDLHVLVGKLYELEKLGLWTSSQLGEDPGGFDPDSCANIRSPDSATFSLGTPRLSNRLCLIDRLNLRLLVSRRVIPFSELQTRYYPQLINRDCPPTFWFTLEQERCVIQLSDSKVYNLLKCLQFTTRFMSDSNWDLSAPRTPENTIVNPVPRASSVSSATNQGPVAHTIGPELFATKRKRFIASFHVRELILQLENKGYPVAECRLEGAAGTWIRLTGRGGAYQGRLIVHSLSIADALTNLGEEFDLLVDSNQSARLKNQELRDLSLPNGTTAPTVFDVFGELYKTVLSGQFSKPPEGHMLPITEFSMLSQNVTNLAVIRTPKQCFPLLNDNIINFYDEIIRLLDGSQEGDIVPDIDDQAPDEKSGSPKDLMHAYFDWLPFNDPQSPLNASPQFCSGSRTVRVHLDGLDIVYNPETVSEIHSLLRQLSALTKIFGGSETTQSPSHESHFPTNSTPINLMNFRLGLERLCVMIIDICADSTKVSSDRETMMEPMPMRKAEPLLLATINLLTLGMQTGMLFCFHLLLCSYACFYQVHCEGTTRMASLRLAGIHLCDMFDKSPAVPYLLTSNFSPAHPLEKPDDPVLDVQMFWHASDSIDSRFSTHIETRLSHLTYVHHQKLLSRIASYLHRILPVQSGGEQHGLPRSTSPRSEHYQTRIKLDLLSPHLLFPNLSTPHVLVARATSIRVTNSSLAVQSSDTKLDAGSKPAAPIDFTRKEHFGLCVHVPYIQVDIMADLDLRPVPLARFQSASTTTWLSLPAGKQTIQLSIRSRQVALLDMLPLPEQTRTGAPSLPAESEMRTLLSANPPDFECTSSSSTIPISDHLFVLRSLEKHSCERSASLNFSAELFASIQIQLVHLLCRLAPQPWVLLLDFCNLSGRPAAVCKGDNQSSNTSTIMQTDGSISARSNPMQCASIQAQINSFHLVWTESDSNVSLVGPSCPHPQTTVNQDFASLVCSDLTIRILDQLAQYTQWLPAQRQKTPENLPGPYRLIEGSVADLSLSALSTKEKRLYDERLCLNKSIVGNKSYRPFRFLLILSHLMHSMRPRQGEEAYLWIRLSPIQYVHTQHFLSSMLDTLNGLLQNRDMMARIRASSEGLQLPTTAPTSLRVLLDVYADSPTLILPVSEASPECLVTTMSQLTVANSFLWVDHDPPYPGLTRELTIAHTSEETCTSCASCVKHSHYIQRHPQQQQWTEPQTMTARSSIAQTTVLLNQRTPTECLWDRITLNLENATIHHAAYLRSAAEPTFDSPDQTGQPPSARVDILSFSSYRICPFPGTNPISSSSSASCTSSSSSSFPHLFDPRPVTFILGRNLSSAYSHIVPDWRLTSQWHAVQVRLTARIYSVIRGILLHNLSGPVLPLSPPTHELPLWIGRVQQPIRMAHSPVVYPPKPTIQTSITGVVWTAITFWLDLRDTQIQFFPELDSTSAICPVIPSAQLDLTYARFSFDKLSNHRSWTELVCSKCELVNLRDFGKLL
ncbi:unnamed protein product [Echinostoma caproni]|uniref:VPS13_mid_rpt domain-containing protein n=1 Tax=Echinostoma caproni TaxID=27848 RepID=A0A183ACH1_9TREM|nr:unnamed protein product [Echinostoma caproni]